MVSLLNLPCLEFFSSKCRTIQNTEYKGVTKPTEIFFLGLEGTQNFKSTHNFPNAFYNYSVGFIFKNLSFKLVFLNGLLKFIYNHHGLSLICIDLFSYFYFYF